MELHDKTIKCKDCGQEFIFTIGEQQFYQEKGFTSDPVRCKECRAKKKQNHENRNKDVKNN